MTKARVNADNASADIQGVTAGTGLTGGGTSGTVTLSLDTSAVIQPTVFDAKADILTATADNTPARLAVGTNGQVLTAASTTATGLQWATPSAGSYTLIASGSLSGTSTTISSISNAYTDLYFILRDYTNASESALRLRLNSISTGYDYTSMNNNSTALDNSQNATEITPSSYTFSSDQGQELIMTLPNYTSTSSQRMYQIGSYSNNTLTWRTKWVFGGVRTSDAISSITIFSDGTATWTGGTYALYGVK